MTISAPQHIIIVGSGVFGLSTAYALTRRSRYARTSITLVSTDFSEARHDSARPLISSIDSTRIIRGDYADPMYARLMREAHALWRHEDWSSRGRYNESGLVITATAGASGADYIKKSLANVKALDESAGIKSSARYLPNRDAIIDALGVGKITANGTGDMGYINPASGWANAEQSIRDLEVWLRESKRVDFVTDEVVKIVADDEGSRVRGLRLSTGKVLVADSFILATGAWTPKLIDLRGRASSRAQVMAYFDLTDAEARALQKIPVCLDLGSGCFVFPPNRKADGKWEIKTARHSYGYSNPVSIEAPLGADKKSVTISLPSAKQRTIPTSDEAVMSNFLADAVPLLASRKPRGTRLCYYLDTASGDFIVDFHPQYHNLFVTTGGSGHAFKFLPILGEKVLDVFESRKEAYQLRQQWRFPERQADDEVWCQDGSRSGPTNVTLTQAMTFSNTGGGQSRL